ncbi:hypothetical protein ABNK63_00350 [Rhodanobacter sp. IGA1.0]|uniref:Secreted protein n=1 Tax=Rhodanobacter sp. IGA1.0 TaxID=3158582 RepID=A0AAU7QKW7_9GAMM
MVQFTASASTAVHATAAENLRCLCIAATLFARTMRRQANVGRVRMCRIVAVTKVRHAVTGGCSEAPGGHDIARTAARTVAVPLVIARSPVVTVSATTASATVTLHDSRDGVMTRNRA